MLEDNEQFTLKLMWKFTGLKTTKINFKNLRLDPSIVFMEVMLW